MLKLQQWFPDYLMKDLTLGCHYMNTIVHHVGRRLATRRLNILKVTMVHVHGHLFFHFQLVIVPFALSSGQEIDLNMFTCMARQNASTFVILLVKWHAHQSPMLLMENLFLLFCISPKPFVAPIVRNWITHLQIV